MARPAGEGREGRILDAAARLFAHYGYDKTTVDDIAREAGVSKGAIYLHFKGKDELFEGLFIREMQRFAGVWLALLDADPRGGTMAGMYKNMLYALKDCPFIGAMLRQDRQVFGSYLRRPDTVLRSFQGGMSPRHQAVQMLQEAGAIRADIDARVIAHIMNMLSFGLVGMGEVVPAAETPPVEELIEAIGKILDRALTPEGGGDSEAGKAIIRQITEAARQQLAGES
jgi:AcrR family transcriptional regulator